jgi:hypothetical protein
VSSIGPAGRAARVAAVAFGVLTLAVGLSSVPLDSMARQPGPHGALSWVFTVLVMTPAVGVGTLLAARRPRNPIGWLVLAIFLLAVAPVGDYAIIDYRMHHGTLPFGGVAVVLLVSWPVWLVLLALLLWLFPDGQLPRGRWRPVSVAVLTAGLLLALAATAGGAADVAGQRLVIDAEGDLANNGTGPAALAQVVTVAGALVSLLVWVAVQVPTFRHASGERRQQFKWLYSGAVVFVATTFVAVLTPGGPSWWDQAAENVVAPLGFAVLPVCIGVAVLKYRLYAIDRIISRVIAYALVTATLGGMFAGLVLLATRVLPVRAPEAVAAATLAAAALFNPLRRRVQRRVDRRFNRTRYNAEQVVAAFTARLRHTVDLDAVQADLTDAVSRAFEPAHVMVWVAPRPAEVPGGPQRVIHRV